MSAAGPSQGARPPSGERREAAQGGRHTRRAAFALALLGCLATAPALAAPCAGFADVDDASVFCPNVDWLKNRAVTLGCTATTLYCPTQLVSRLSMAAFMHRLGLALTPNVLYQEASGATLDLDSPPATVCATGVLAAATYPRSLKAVAVMTGRFDTPGIVGLRLVQSTDGGTNWTPIGTTLASAGGAQRWVTATVLKGDVPLATGTSYRFGLRAERTGTGTGDVATWNCQLEAVVASRTAAASPF
jgi:hypothetical protein